MRNIFHSVAFIRWNYELVGGPLRTKASLRTKAELRGAVSVIEFGAIYKSAARCLPSVVESMNWIQLGTDIDGESADDGFGRSISMSANGERVVIGAPDNNVNESCLGHSWVYSIDGTSWK